ncbi:MAG: hypothetical protein K2X39_08830, partial [Silvanigrellaceae bacterium]|nr:hypothetical protein [Silvanigrellaceae bacterium]
MFKIAILSPGIFEFDAVGNDCLQMHRFFKAYGISSQLFAPSWGEGIECFPLKKLESFLSTDSLIIYHFCVGWPKGFELVKNLGLKY